MDSIQTRLDGRADEDLQLAHLVDRLIARLGARAVFRPVFYESHIPERAEGWAGALTGNHDAAVTVRTDHDRPVRLLDRAEQVQVVYGLPEGPPAQFVWRRQTHRVLRYQGPERLAPEWWRDGAQTRLRDYYKVEDDTGRRFWLYREGVHDDGRGGDPRWFLHGMFA